jgi:outer membrane protein assembly factor BamB
MLLKTNSIVLLAVLFVLSGVAAADNWPQWRGASGDGVSAESGLPREWSRERNLVWRVELPGAGNSTPVIWGDRIFLTQPPVEKNQRGLLCLDAGTGQTIWSRTVEWSGADPTHSTNPLCSSSAVTDGERVIAWFGSAGIHCWDFDGGLLWSRDFGVQEHIWGYGASPVIADGRVYLNFGPGENSALYALDVKTGAVLWQRAEPLDRDGTGEAKFQSADYTGSWSTPVLRSLAGRSQLLLSVPFRVRSFDPADGRELWVSEGTNALCYTSPLVSGDSVIAMGGYNGMAVAVRADGSGDVTGSHRLWRHPKTQQRIGSGVVYGGHIYIHNDPGIAECFDAKTGELKWEQRLSGPGGKGTNWSSVAVTADGVCYTLNQSGDCFVWRASPEGYEQLAVNSLGESSNSSVAISRGRLYLRTHKALWCVGP